MGLTEIIELRSESAGRSDDDASIAICENRQCDLTIRDVMVDPFSDEIFACSIRFHRLDRSIFPQLADNIVALCICVGIRGVGDLK